MEKLYSRFHVFIFLFIIVPFCHSQSAPQWRFWSTPDGLTESWVGAITYDNDNNLWAIHGQVDLMSRMNGWSDDELNFTVNLPSPGASARVRQNAHGDLWSISNMGLQRFDSASAIWKQYPIEVIRNYSNQISGNFATHFNLRFLPNGQNRVWILFPQRLMYFLENNRTMKQIKYPDELNMGAYLSLWDGPESSFWIACESGFILVKKPYFDDSCFIPFRFPDEMYLENLRQPIPHGKEQFFAVAFSHIHQKDVLIEFTHGQWHVRETRFDNIYRGWSGDNGIIWIEVKDGDLSTLFEIKNDNIKTVKRNSVLAGIFHDVLIRDSGEFWLATSTGLARHAPALWRIPPEVEAIKSRIHDIYHDPQDRIWFDAQNALLKYANGKWKIYDFPKGFRSKVSNTKSLVLLPSHEILISHENSSQLLLFQPEKEKFRFLDHPKNRTINFISAREDDTVWLETYGSHDQRTFYIEHFDGVKFSTLFQASLEHIGHIRFIEELDSGTLWFGGSGHPGLGRYKNGTFSIIGEEEGFPGSGVFSIHELHNGNLLFGDRDRIYEYNGETWKLIRNHLDRVNAMITARDDTLWVASGMGLHRYDGNAWITYSVEDGLPVSFIYKVYQDREGRIWAGTAQGISLFNPQADRDPPQTFIRNEENLIQTPPGGNVRIVYTGVDKWKHTHAERLLFSYRIDDQPWSDYRSEKIAVINGLGSGEHTFQVKAMDMNSNVDTSPAKITFTVMPYWYKQSSVLTLIIMSTLLLLILIVSGITRHVTLEKLVRLRTNDLSQANQKLKDELLERKRLEKEILNIRDSEQRRIGQDLHDGLIQHLTGIEYMLKWLKRKMEISSSEDTNHLEEISQEIHHAINETEEIARGMNPIVLELDGLYEALCELATRTEHLFDVSCQFQGDPSFTMSSKNSSLQIYRIAQECINNSIKHGQAHSINLILQSTPDEIRLKIVDDGIGFPDDPDQTRGMGLQIMKHRAHIIGAKLTIERRPEGGTTVMCILRRSNQDDSNKK